MHVERIRLHSKLLRFQLGSYEPLLCWCSVSVVCCRLCFTDCCMASTVVDDTYLITSFFLFAITSWVFEAYIVFSVEFSDASQVRWCLRVLKLTFGFKIADVDVFAKLWNWYSQFDPIFFHPPTWLRIMCALDMFLFGSCYLILIYGFLNKREWVHPVGLLFGSALLYSTIVYFWYEITVEVERANLTMVVLVNIPYTIMPIILIARTWKQPVWPSPENSKLLQQNKLKGT